MLSSPLSEQTRSSRQIAGLAGAIPRRPSAFACKASAARVRRPPFNPRCGKRAKRSGSGIYIPTSPPTHLSLDMQKNDAQKRFTIPLFLMPL